MHHALHNAAGAQQLHEAQCHSSCVGHPEKGSRAEKWWAQGASWNIILVSIGCNSFCTSTRDRMHICPRKALPEDLVMEAIGTWCTLSAMSMNPEKTMIQFVVPE